MYLLFGGQFYYARGGCHDYLACSDDLDQLVKVAKHIADITASKIYSIDWWHIVDSSNPVAIVAKSQDQAHGVDEFDLESVLSLPSVRLMRQAKGSGKKKGTS